MAIVLFQGKAPTFGSSCILSRHQRKGLLFVRRRRLSYTFTTLQTSAVVAPSITTQPASWTGLVGGNASLSVGARGTSPLMYQWQFSGNRIPEATNATLVIPDFQSANAGSYQVVITNNFQEITTSAVATLTVALVPSITTAGQRDQSGGQHGGADRHGQRHSPLRYQWRKNGTAAAKMWPAQRATA